MSFGRSRSITWLELILRWSRGFSARYTKPVLTAPPPPVKAMTLSTAGSPLMMATKRSVSLCMAWNEMSWAA